MNCKANNSNNNNNNDNTNTHVFVYNIHVTLVGQNAYLASESTECGFLCFVEPGLWLSRGTLSLPSLLMHALLTAMYHLSGPETGKRKRVTRKAGEKLTLLVNLGGPGTKSCRFWLPISACPV